MKYTRFNERLQLASKELERKRKQAADAAQAAKTEPEKGNENAKKEANR